MTNTDVRECLGSQLIMLDYPGEEEVYLCKWKKTDTGFRLWLKDHPKIFVEGDDDVHELSEELSELIGESGGATRAVLEFVTPLPQLPLAGPESMLLSPILSL